LNIPIIILNWKNNEDTLECVRSVLNTAEDANIILIDNDSGTGSQHLLADEVKGFKSVSLILNNQNLGFARAHNAVLISLLNDYDYVFLLNNDTTVDNSFKNSLYKLVLTEKPDMLSCKMVNYFNRAIMDNAGHFLLSTGEILPLGHGQGVSMFEKKISNIGACGGAALYSTKMLKDIGIFDEYFTTGYEDAELGLRAFVAGYKCTFEPSLLVFHKMSRSIKKVFNFNFALKTQCNVYYTYLKLVHWQVILINFIPWLTRMVLIIVVSALLFRVKVLKVQLRALYIVFFKERKHWLTARRLAKGYRRIHWTKLLINHTFFLWFDIKRFYRFYILGKKSYFDRYY